MRKILIPIALIALALAGVLLTRSERPEWTTARAEALPEFEAALEALNRLYFREAYDRLAATLEIDPDFALARLLMLQFLGPDEREAEVAELERLDVRGLTDRERFLLSYELAHHRGDGERARAVLEEYAAEHADDPYYLFTRAEQAWREQAWDDAERYYRELIDHHPNWVRAQNYLGYIEMTRGNFEVAEDHFRTYMFVAPDQANPYDSIGELFILLGREGEAEEALRKAIEIRPDFCSSYARLIDLRTLQGTSDGVDEIVESASEHCGGPEGLAKTLRCRAGLWKEIAAGDFDAATEILQTECGDIKAGDFEIARYQLALGSGQPEIADDMEAQLRRIITGELSSGRPDSGHVRAVFSHLLASRAAHEGRWDDAIDGFRKADRLLQYWAVGEGTGIFKLRNRLELARVLRRAGREVEADEALQQIGRVNPTLVARYGANHPMLASDPEADARR